MKFLPDTIFPEFKDKVIEESYYPIHPMEMLKARLVATWLLQNPNPDILIKATAFITKTSTFIEEDLFRLQQLASQTKNWDELQICSSYTNTLGTFLEYKLSFTTLDGQKQGIHCHARYEMKEGHCLFISQNPPLIRLAGDPVLQKPGILFPEDPSPEQQQELVTQLEIVKSVLIQTSAAGIAANQCVAIENPYRFTIVGVFYENPDHVIGVGRRYPGTKFPQAKIMLNPVITAVSKETQQFNHACLSVPCANRCAVLSPMEMSVKYQDPLNKGVVNEDVFTGIDAVVLWHELTHIVYGKTYMDITFESLSVEDLLQFKKMLTDEMKHRLEDYYSHLPDLSVSPFHFSVKINKEGNPKLDPIELTAVLPNMSEDTLYGLYSRCRLMC